MTAKNETPHPPGGADGGGDSEENTLPTIKTDSTYKKVGGVIFGKADAQRHPKPILQRDEQIREQDRVALGEQITKRGPKSTTNPVQIKKDEYEERKSQPERASKSTTNHLRGIESGFPQNPQKPEEIKTILHEDRALTEQERLVLGEQITERGPKSTTNPVQIKEGEKSDSESGLSGDIKDLHEDRALTEQERLVLGEQITERGPKSTTNPVQIKEIDRDRGPCNLLLTSLLAYYSTTTTQIYQEEVVDLEAFLKRFSEIVGILKENKEEKACILLFAEKHHVVYQGIIHKLYPQANVWTRLQDLKNKGFLEPRERSEIEERILRPIEAAITRVSRAGEKQIEQIKYYSLTEEGKLFIRIFKKSLFNVLPEAKREQIKDLNALLYHSHKQHEFVEQNRIKAEKAQQIREEEAKKDAKLEELIGAHEEEIAALTRVDFEGRPSEKLQELLTTLRHETGKSHKIKEIKDAWRLVTRKRSGLA